jgi:hemolysin III
MLLLRVHSPGVLVPTVIYCCSLIGMFGVSALYHRPSWNAYQRTIMKRIDHSAIFILIAGSGTPIYALALDNTSGFRLFTVMWVAAVLGVAKCLFWVNSPKCLSAILYVAMGWLALTYISEIHAALGPVGFTCLVTGGVVYSVGAVVYALKKPNPYPAVFGYHEIFHTLVIIAAIFHFAAILPLIK